MEVGLERPLKLLSWNVNVRRDAAGQVAALAAFAPDVIALQEVARGRVAAFREAFAAVGLPHVAETMSAWANGEGNRQRERGVLIAARWPLAPLPDAPAFAVPWPERVLSVRLHTPYGEIELYTVYMPTGVHHPEPKLSTLTRLCARLACERAVPRILCGDFNLPQAELPDGTLVTFAQTRRANGGYSMPTAAGKRAMHAAEHAVMRGLAAHDLPDVYRQLHGFAATDASWVAPNSGAGFRLDHVFASRCLRARSCRYLHGLREGGWSDHSAVEVVFAPDAPLPRPPPVTPAWGGGDAWQDLRPSPTTG